MSSVNHQPVAATQPTALHRTLRLLKRLAATSLGAALLFTSTPTLAALGQNNKVGHILGSSIYKADLSYDQENGAADHLQKRILNKVIASYRSANAEVIEPKAFELLAADELIKEDFREFLSENAPDLFESLMEVRAALRNDTLSDDDRQALIEQRDRIQAQLAPPQPKHVWFYVLNWKFQQHLYDTYGGGRVLLQNFGPEAVDATVNWLKEREAAGDFEIQDDDLRTAFYQQWQIETQAGGQTAIPPEQMRRLEQRQYDKNRYRLLNPGWFSPEQ